PGWDERAGTLRARPRGPGGLELRLANRGEPGGRRHPPGARGPRREGGRVMRSTQWESRLTLPVSEDRDHIQGSAAARVTLVQYGDYECPYCGEAYPIVKNIQERMGEQLRFVFRNFPITTSHPHAEHAAEAAEAAATQDRFWEMHDHLYEHQRRLTDDDLHGYARALDLD